MSKYRLLLVIFFLGFFAIVVKLFYIQVVNPKYSSETYYFHDKKILPIRGRIFDRSGQPLVLNTESFLLYAQPKVVFDKEALIEKIDQMLHLGQATLEARLSQDKDWVILTKDLDIETKEKIEALNLAGIGFDNGYQRYYPEASLAAHLLGFVGKNYWGESVGYFGIEGYFEKELAGLPGMIKTERDILGRPIFFGTQERIDPENGADIYLTIDKSVQIIAKKRLKEGLDLYQAKEGCVLIVEPDTVKICASVCLPDFDQSKYAIYNEAIFKNPAISNLYEPGSIFKPLIVAAALEEKKITANDFVTEDGPVKIGDHFIRTWDNKYEGKISITRVLERSSNVGMLKIGQKLGEKKIYQYLERFGFGRLTNIGLQGEIAGQLKPIDQWYSIDFATVTFGQGIAVTPIQFVRAFAALINGGRLMEPLVVEKFVFGDKEKFVYPKEVKRVISSKVSATIKRMLEKVVENGEIRWEKPEGYSIAGKTGTAQIPIAGRYDPSKTIASFVGFAPVTNPKFLVLVILKEPKTSVWGSETAAPLFFKIARDLIVYYGILPEE